MKGIESNRDALFLFGCWCYLDEEGTGQGLHLSRVLHHA